MTEGQNPPNSSEREPLDVHQLLLVMIEQTTEVAWQKLGLRPDAMTGKIVRDVEQARVAIDATSALAALIEPKLDEEDKRHLQSMLRDLKINYVQHSGGGGA